MGLVLAIYNTHNTMYVMNINCNVFLIDYDSRLCDRKAKSNFCNKHQDRVFVKDYRTLSLLWTTKYFVTKGKNKPNNKCAYTPSKKSSNNVSLPTTSYACYFEHLM